MSKIAHLTEDLLLCKDDSADRWYIKTKKGDVDVSALNVEQLKNLLKVDGGKEFKDYVNKCLNKLLQPSDLVGEFINSLDNVNSFKPTPVTDPVFDYADFITEKIEEYLQSENVNRVEIELAGRHTKALFVCSANCYSITPVGQFLINFKSNTIKGAVILFLQAYKNYYNVQEIIVGGDKFTRG